MSDLAVVSAITQYHRKCEQRPLHETDCDFKHIIAEDEIGEVVPHALYVPLRLLANM